ncbi:exodeoxyribonuclease III [Rossellomorea oryzaecorticis]|uniref:Exodeoxyribonuclease III n=1 Tax=Rossellomorea oryzaecorticis TaxID=1396505 RepID=A0ABU9K9V0_9BACI
MKLVSWNVNGIRACVKKGFLDYFNEVNADIFCIQESKLQEGQIELNLPQYEQYWNYAERKGYSGTAVFTKIKPLSVSYGFQEDEREPEGRIITLEFDHFYLVNIYTPNSKRDLSRLDERLEWEDNLRHYLLKLDGIKPVILCGDLNVAHKEIDLKNDRSNRGNSGFTDVERGKMTLFLESGFVDSFRYLYPEKDESYTWWSYMSKVRERNIGWRIDYFILSKRMESCIIDADIHSSILGSDHCPVYLELDFYEQEDKYEKRKAEL